MEFKETTVRSLKEDLKVFLSDEIGKQERLLVDYQTGSYNEAHANGMILAFKKCIDEIEKILKP